MQSCRITCILLGWLMNASRIDIFVNPKTLVWLQILPSNLFSRWWNIIIIIDTNTHKHTHAIWIGTSKVFLWILLNALHLYGVRMFLSIFLHVSWALRTKSHSHRSHTSKEEKKSFRRFRARFLCFQVCIQFATN